MKIFIKILLASYFLAGANSVKYYRIKDMQNRTLDKLLIDTGVHFTDSLNIESDPIFLQIETNDDDFILKGEIRSCQIGNTYVQDKNVSILINGQPTFHYSNATKTFSIKVKVKNFEKNSGELKCQHAALIVIN